MNRFVEYMESRHLQPLYKEAAHLISLNIDNAIDCCKNLMVKDSERSYVYELIIENLNTVDYQASANKIRAAKQAQLQAKIDAENKKKKDVEDQIEREKQQKAKDELVARLKLSGGRVFPTDPPELINMLRHIGNQLNLLNAKNKISQDYASAINAIIMDLNSHIKRKSLNPEKELQISQQRQEKSVQDLESGAIKVKRYNDLLEIVKVLRDKGLSNSVSDATAAAAYDKLYDSLLKIHRSGNSIRQTLNHWIRNNEIGNHYATPEELEVMRVVSSMTNLLTPGKYKHQPKETEEPITEPEPTPETESKPSEPENDDEDDDEDLMKPKNNDEDDDDLMKSNNLDQSVPKRRHKQVSMFDVSKLKDFDFSKVNPNNKSALLKDAVKQSFVGNNDLFDSVKKQLDFVLHYLSVSMANAGSNLTRFVNMFFNEKHVIDGEVINPDAIQQATEIRNIFGGQATDELKKIIVYSLGKIYGKRSNESNNNLGISLQEQQQHSRMLKVLAGIQSGKKVF